MAGQKYLFPGLDVVTEFGRGNGVNLYERQFLSALQSAEAIAASSAFIENVLIPGGVKVKLTKEFRVGDTTAQVLYFEGLKALKEKYKNNKVIGSALSGFEPVVFVNHEADPAQPQAFSDFRRSLLAGFYNYQIDDDKGKFMTDEQVDLYLSEFKKEGNLAAKSARDITKSYLTDLDEAMLCSLTPITAGLDKEACVGLNAKRAFTRLEDLLQGKIEVQAPSKFAQTIGTILENNTNLDGHDFTPLYSAIQLAKGNWLRSNRLNTNIPLYDVLWNLEDRMRAEYELECEAKKSTPSSFKCEAPSFSVTRAAIAGAAAALFFGIPLLQVLRDISNTGTAQAEQTRAYSGETEVELDRGVFRLSPDLFQLSQLGPGKTVQLIPGTQKIVYPNQTASEIQLVVKDLVGNSEQTISTNLPVEKFNGFSAGKTKVAFCEKDGPIYIKDYAGISKTKLGGHSESPSISPDGNKIAFIDKSPRTISVSNIDGTGRINLLDDTSSFRLGPPKWSPDCKSIFVLTDNGTWTNPEIFKLMLDGKISKLTYDRAPDTFDVSADGKKIVYDDTYYTEVGVINSDGSGHTKVFSQSRSLVYYRPTWFPDGTKILAYKQFYKDGMYHQDLYTLDLSGKQTRLTNTPELEDNAFWTPNGKLGFTRDDFKHIYLIDLNNYALPPQEDRSWCNWKLSDISVIAAPHTEEFKKASSEDLLFAVLKLTLGNEKGEANYVDDDIAITVPETNCMIGTLKAKVEASWTDEDGKVHTDATTHDLKLDSRSGGNARYVRRVAKGVPAPVKDTALRLMTKQFDLQRAINYITGYDYPDAYVTELIINGQTVDIEDVRLPGLDDHGLPPGTVMYSFEVASPVDISVKDPQGKTTGAVYTNGLFTREASDIPRSFYSGRNAHPEFIVIAGAKPGDYAGTIIGTGDGSYSSSVKVFNERETLESRVDLNKSIYSGQVKAVSVAVPGEKEESTSNGNDNNAVCIGIAAVGGVAAVIGGALYAKKKQEERDDREVEELPLPPTFNDDPDSCENIEERTEKSTYEPYGDLPDLSDWFERNL